MSEDIIYLKCIASFPLSTIEVGAVMAIAPTNRVYMVEFGTHNGKDYPTDYPHLFTPITEKEYNETPEEKRVC